jgi:phospholipase/carboxylesterase
MFDDSATMRWLPRDGGRAEQLMILLHGGGHDASTMVPMAETLRHEFPQALLLAPQADGIAGETGDACQWFPAHEDDQARQAELVAAVLPELQRFVQAAQMASGVGPAATALVGFSEGAVLALELSALQDGLAGRVLAFGGRYVQLPQRAPRYTTFHFFHGADDGVIPAEHSRAALQRLGELHGDATVDIATGIGHELAPVLLQCAIERLRSHIPHRTWAAALGAVPGLSERLHDDDGA